MSHYHRPARSSPEDRYRPFPGEQMTPYLSPFRSHFLNVAAMHSERTIDDASPRDFLALEFYIYLITYTTIPHEDVCVVLYVIMEQVDWEMLAIMDEARNLDVPNIYDEEDDAEEEDLWTKIRSLPEDCITDGFDALIRRSDSMGFSHVGILRKQVGRRTWVVRWDDRGFPIQYQHRHFNSRFDTDFTTSIDGSARNVDPIIQNMRTLRRVGSLWSSSGQFISASKSNYQVGDQNEAMDIDNGQSSDDSENSDSDLARAIELSKREF